MNKLFLLLSTVLIMLTYPFLVKGQNVFINEYSQGHWAHSHDWVELVVTSDGTDIRGLKFTSYSTRWPQYTLQLSRNSNFSNLPKGSIIVIYANFSTSHGSSDSLIQAWFPTGDLDFTDHRVVIPFDSNAVNTTYFTAASHWPVLPGYGTNIALFDSLDNGIFGLGYGSYAYMTDSSLFTIFGKVKLGDIPNRFSAHFTGDAINTLPSDSTNWQIVAFDLATPGSLNGGDNNTLPVELTSFSASVIKGNTVSLNWETATEVNNYGFEIERKAPFNPPEGGNVGEWNTIGFVEGHGNSNSPKHYSFVDNEINQSGIYYYRLKQIDNDGTYEYSNISSVNVGVPGNYYLSQNYPNPFNPTTKIDFTIPEKQPVSLRIYNVLGDLVQELVNEEKAAGSYSITFNASNLPSGVYIYRLQTPSFSQNRKMTFLK